MSDTYDPNAEDWQSQLNTSQLPGPQYPDWVMGGLAAPSQPSPGFPAYDPLDPRKAANAGAIGNAYDPTLSPLAYDLAVPQSPMDYALLAAGPIGRVAGKAAKIGALAAGAYGNMTDEAEAGGRFPLTGIAMKDTIANLAKLNRLVTTKEIPTAPLNPHDIPVGSWLTPLVGDRSASGQLLTHVGEKQLPDPVQMQGGFQYMPEWMKQNVAWASNAAPSAAIANRAQGFLDQGVPNVYGVYTAMSPQAIDASHHMSDTLSQMLKLERDKIGTTAGEKFDTLMKSADPAFPGVKSDDLQQYLRDVPMQMRNYFAKTMNQREALKAGFPDVAQARIATTHPALLDAPNYSSGLSIGTLTGERTHGAAAADLAPHFTYPSKIHGRYVGGTPLVPQEVMWPDFSAKVGARNPSAVGKIWLGGLKGEPMGQLVTPQWQDTYAERLRRMGMGDIADLSGYQP